VPILTIFVLSHPGSVSAARDGASRRRARDLVDWFAVHERPLPWRIDRDPYRIWVAEVLLQQTRVAQAVPYFERLVARYPTVQALAEAPLEELRKLWEGAGYYRRAENLWRAAREVAGPRRGRFPTTAEGWRELPGVGPYIAGAVASLAFGERIAAPDANALRVAARWIGAREDPRSSAGHRRLVPLLTASLEGVDPARFNEALMELGETVCRPRQPRCDACPVRRDCAGGRGEVDPATLPLRRPRPPKPHHRAAVVVLERSGRWLVQQRPEGGLLPGLWEFPGGHIERGESSEGAARRELTEETGVVAGRLTHLGAVRHAYSHFSVTLEVFRGPAARAAAVPSAARWVTPTEFEALPRPRATVKVAALVRDSPRARSSRGSGSRRGRGSP